MLLLLLLVNCADQEQLPVCAARVEKYEYIYDFSLLLIVSLVEFSKARLLLRYLNTFLRLTVPDKYRGSSFVCLFRLEWPLLDKFPIEILKY